MQAPEYYIHTKENALKVNLAGQAGSFFDFVDITEQEVNPEANETLMRLRFTKEDIEFLLQIFPLMLPHLQDIG